MVGRKDRGDRSIDRIIVGVDTVLAASYHPWVSEVPKSVSKSRTGLLGRLH